MKDYCNTIIIAFCIMFLVVFCLAGENMKSLRRKYEEEIEELVRYSIDMREEIINMAKYNDEISTQFGYYEDTHSAYEFEDIMSDIEDDIRNILNIEYENIYSKDE